MRALAAAGFALVAVMLTIFVVTGTTRPFPYVPVQTVALLATCVLVFAAARGSRAALAIGFGGNALMRIAQIAMGLSRLSLFSNAGLAIGWTWATVEAARGKNARVALWVLGLIHAIAMFESFQRAEAAAGLAIGSAGLMIAAANV